MKKLDKLGKGIILLHDFHKHTAEALPELLRKLKAGGYKVVAMRAKDPVQTLTQYDDLVLKDAKLPTVSSRLSPAWCRRSRNRPVRARWRIYASKAMSSYPRTACWQTLIA